MKNSKNKIQNQENKGSILIVDDDKTHRMTLSLLLTKNGYTVFEASSGFEAIKMVRERIYDLVLLDVMMPEVDGFKTLREIRQKYSPSELPIILVTAKEESDSIVQGLELGANDYIRKPVDPQVTIARIQTQIALKRTSVELLQSQKLKSLGELAGGIAHEMNTPTQYIGDNVRFLKDAFEDLSTLLSAHQELFTQAKTQNGKIDLDLIDKVNQAVQKADFDYLSNEIPIAIQQSLDGIERVSSIVSSMKEFSHPGGGEKEAVDINKCINSTVTVARNEWKYVADLETELEENLPQVRCHAGEINQVLLNIIINASHAIGDKVNSEKNEKGLIKIKTKSYDDWIEISIQDTGTGIPREVQNRVFDPFFTTKEIGKGTGQGLTMAHSVIVNKHKGSLDFKTIEGLGTTFIIKLPLYGELSSIESNP